MTIPIKINNVEGANQIINWASKQSFEVYLSSGANVMINAKSLLGACALIGAEVHLVVPDHVPIEELTKALKTLMTA